MKILFITHRIPYPARDGGLVATLNLLNGLRQQGIEIKLLCINASRDQNDATNLPAYFYDELELEFVNVDTRIKPLSALLHLFINKSYNISRFINKEFENLVVQKVKHEKFDIVHFENLFSTGALHRLYKRVNTPLTVRIHNIEHLIWQQLSRQAKSPLKRMYLAMLARQLKRYELKTLTRANAIVSITQADATWLSQSGLLNNYCVITHGLDDNSFIEIKEGNVNPKSVYHLASMDWMPNTEAMRWFVNDI